MSVGRSIKRLPWESHDMSKDFTGKHLTCHRNPWIPIDSYGLCPNSFGYQWIPIDSFGFPWIPMDSYGFLWIRQGFLWTPMDSYRFHKDSYRFLRIPWNPTESYGILWIPTRLGEQSYWIPMDSYGFLMIPMDSYGSPWIPIDSYESL